MEVLFLLLSVSFLIALAFLIAFLLAIKNGAYDDLDSPSVRMLHEDSSINTKVNQSQ